MPVQGGVNARCTTVRGHLPGREAGRSRARARHGPSRGDARPGTGRRTGAHPRAVRRAAGPRRTHRPCENRRLLEPGSGLLDARVPTRSPMAAPFESGAPDLVPEKPAAAPTPTPAPPSAGAGAGARGSPRRPDSRFGKRDPTDKAKRLARVLVSDMIMYNSERHETALEPEARSRLPTSKKRSRSRGRNTSSRWERRDGRTATGRQFWKDALNDILAKGETGLLALAVSPA